MGAVATRVVRTLDEAWGLAPAWEELADRAGGRHHTQPWWALTWWRHYGQEGRGELHVAVAEVAGRPVALAPLWRRRVAGISRLAFLGSGMSPVSELLVAPGADAAARQLWQELTADRRSVVELHGFRHPSASLAALRRSAPPAWSAELTEVCPVVSLDGDLERYLEQRPAALRRKLRRAARPGDGDAAATVQVLDDPRDVTTCLAELVPVFDAAERANPRRHFLAGADRAFSEEVLFEGARRGRAVVVVARVDGRPVASAFAFRSGEVWGYSAPRFLPALSARSPGHVVLQGLISHAHTSGARLVDLLAGDAQYKREWSTGSYDLLRVVASGSGRLHAARRLVALARS